MLGRREALIAGGAAIAAAACDRSVSAISEALGAAIPRSIAVPHRSSRSFERHLLDRAAFGPWPGDEERVRAIGAGAWIEAQLHPERIDDSACSVRTACIDAVSLPSDLAFELRPEDVEAQLVAHTILRAVYSRRQLAEVLVSFFGDLFNVHIGKDLCRHLIVAYDRDVIRPRILGRFVDLVRAVTLSPAMLVYLDGRDNKVERARDVPNENHARELLELHTLGVHGGYTQRDVMEAARCLTGWVVLEEGAPGTVRFDPSRHDGGEKIVLGRRIPAGGGARDVDRLLAIVTEHPSCARHVASALSRRFVSDDPPNGLVDRAAAAFARSGGSIRAVVRTILRSRAFASSYEARIKRPFEHVVSSLRALGADTHARGALQAHLAAMGHFPFGYPTPDGYPVSGEGWLGTLLPRWRFSAALAGGELDDTRADVGALSSALGDDRWAPFRHVVGRDPDPDEKRAIERELDRPARAIALALSCPAFQRC